MSETKLSRAIQDALAKLGVWCIRIQTGKVQLLHGGWMQLAEEGTPDLCLPALGSWLEVKTGGGKLKKTQVAWHSKAAKYGVRVAVVRSVGEALAIVGVWQREMMHEKAMGWR